MNKINRQSRSRANTISTAIFQSLSPRSRVWLAGALLSGAALLPAPAATQFSTFFTFNRTNGAMPNSLFRASDGNYYGTTLAGGTTNLGTIFKFSSSGAFTNILSFTGPNGALPVGLLQGVDGNFYGVTSQGASNQDGTIFKLTPAGVISNLVIFDGTNGALPNTGLVQSPADGSFYGTTLIGGTNGNNGTVFQLTTNGNFKTIFSFNGTNGGQPYGMLTFGKDGGLYGTTFLGGLGSSKSGTVFRIDTNGVLTNLMSFDGTTTGGNPYSGVIQVADGNLYGTTAQGSTNGFGDIYRIATNGTGFTVLAAFNSTNGATPYAPLTQAPDGSFYGSTPFGGTNANNGALYQLTTNFNLGLVFSFGNSNGVDGTTPHAALALGPSSDFYGATLMGGTNGGYGTLFKLSLVGGTVPPIRLTISVINSLVSFSWNSAPGITYQLQSTSDFSNSTWSNFGPAITASGTTTTSSDTLPGTGGRYYRVVGVTP